VTGTYYIGTDAVVIIKHTRVMSPTVGVAEENPLR
jgi:hypothetical protein